MGMSASQARFLGLTARKNNVEFEGQQVNQQRTTLSNQSANYYNDLLGMSVPTPPSVDNYTKTVYTFEDGSLSNTITALIPQNDGTYSASYLQETVNDFAIVSSSSSIVNQSGTAGNYTYNIGANQLRGLGEIDTTKIVSNKISLNGISYDVKNDGTDYYVETTQKVKSYAQCTASDINNLEYYYYDDNDPDNITQYYKDTNNSFYSLDTDGVTKIPSSLTEDDMIMSLYDGSQTEPEYAVSFVTKNGNDYQKEVYTDEIKKQTLSAAQIASITTLSSASNDTYLESLTSDQLKSLKDEEAQYLALLQDEFGTDSEWMVRYSQDSSTGKYVPYFYNLSTINTTQYGPNGNSLSNINCYTIGSKNEINEVKNQKGVKMEFDSTGRAINISFPQYDENGNIIPNSSYSTYALTTNTITDQAAYDDAMNQYEYKKYQYDQSINDINSKIQIIQAEDKNLELRLKQLDTEQDAVSQEMDAVTKVIEKNVESSFKTFG